MKLKLMYTRYEEGLLTARFLLPNGQSVIVKGRRYGTWQYINPPPEDGRCEICRRKTDDLAPWDKDTCEVYKQTDKQLEESRHTPSCVTKSITDDRKLIKHFRSFYDGIVEASWECIDCYSLSDEEAIETRNKRYRLYH